VKEFTQSAVFSIRQEYRPLPQLSLDAEQIKKVVTNLVLNAGDALRGPGEIQIETTRLDGWAILSVKDNGCGMTAEFMQRQLFRPFQTTKKKGIGIGMFQSKMIVEAHQGKIEVESAEGKGSTFRVFLPIPANAGE
jgi:signal transduction histidine kinase